MARYTGPRLRIIRRIGTELPGLTTKTAARRPNPPGQAAAGKRQFKISEFGQRLREKHRFWVNNGRCNELWQTAYHDQYDSPVRERYPMAYIEINPSDMRSLAIEAGDVVEVWNEFGSTHAMAYPVADAKPGQTFMVFAHPNGLVGDLTTDWTDRNLIPYYKGTWASVRRVGSGADYRHSVSTKRRSFDAA